MIGLNAGRLPSNWQLAPLDSIADIIISNVDKKEYDGQLPVALCNYTDVYYQDQILGRDDYMPSTASSDQVVRFTVQGGDVAITKDSETADDIGRPSYAPEGIPGLVYGYHLAIYRPFDKRYGPLIRYLFESRPVRAELQARTPGVTRVGLSLDTLRNLKVPLPSPEMATRIASYLDHETAEIDALIVDAQTLVKTVSLRRSGLIDHVFTNTDWPKIALKYRGELRSGLTLGKARDDETRSYPYLRVANVQVGHVDTQHIATIDIPISEAEKFLLRNGDVLMTEGGDRDKLGRGAIWYGEIDPMLHQNHVFAFRCGAQLTPEFLVYGLEATPARAYFDQTARQSTNLASTNSTVVKNFRLPMPPIEDQRAVVDSLDQELTDMSDMVANAKRVADLARERRAALITAAVTGQIDVTARNKPAAEQLEDDIAQGLHREN